MKKMVNRAALIVIGAVGCGGSLGPGEVSLSTIEWWDEEAPLLIEAPSSVRGGDQFVLVLRTFQNLYCEKDAGTHVWVIGLVAKVQPLTHRGGGACPDIAPSPVVRRISMRFTQPGVARIVVHGWSDVARDTIQVENTVVVR